MFIVLLTNIVIGSNHTKCISSSNQNVWFNLLLHRNEYSQEFHYYPFTVKLDRYS